MSLEGPALQNLQLCPACYLVTWTDHDGPHVRQGVPMKPGADPSNGLGTGSGINDSISVPAEPEEC
jgi:hypothetical protein